VWLYYRFALSLRDVSELMLARGVVVSHETIRQCDSGQSKLPVGGHLPPR
jgi:transposase-like protein